MLEHEREMKNFWSEIQRERALICFRAGVQRFSERAICEWLGDRSWFAGYFRSWWAKTLCFWNFQLICEWIQRGKFPRTIRIVCNRLASVCGMYVSDRSATGMLYNRPQCTQGDVQQWHAFYTLLHDALCVCWMQQCAGCNVHSVHPVHTERLHWRFSVTSHSPGSCALVSMETHGIHGMESYRLCSHRLNSSRNFRRDRQPTGPVIGKSGGLFKLEIIW